MSSINRDGSLLELLRIARMDLADVEMDMDDHITDEDLYDIILRVRDNCSAILCDLDAEEGI